MTWTWDPDTFAAHWFDDANDQMPAPLRYRSRFPTLEGLDAHRAAVRAGADPDERDRINLLVHTVSRCELRIEVTGSTVRHYQGNGTTHKQYRIIGARTTQHAAVLFQTAIGDTFSDIRADLLRPEHLPAALAAAVPPCAPGTWRPETFHIDDVKPPVAQQNNHFATDDRNSPHARFHRLARRPADGAGHAVLRLGDYHAPPSRHRHAQWYDLTNDGRYLEQRNATHVDVRPATPQTLPALFTTWLDQATRSLHRTQPSTW